MSPYARCFVALCGSLLLGVCAGMPAQSDVPAGLSTAPLLPILKPRDDPKSAAAPNLAVLPSAATAFTAYITGYSYWDMATDGAPANARPVIHKYAGGTGTYADPITLAVGYSIVNGKQKLDVPLGTRFYLKRLKKYAVVEDLCGAVKNPKNGPCHRYAGHPWYDIYVGGANTTAAAATACARKITRLQPVIMNPAPDLPVRPGEVADSAC